MTIESLLDTDLYKLTMMQAVFHQFPNVEVEYAFKDRTGEVNTDRNLKRLGFAIQTEIENLANLCLGKDEKSYLNSIRFLKSDFVDFLSKFRLNPIRDVSIHIKDKELSIRVKGKWVDTILYEVPILAIISEQFNLEHKISDSRSAPISQAISKALFSKKEGFYFTDFGTRRRFSFDRQKEIINAFVENKDYINFLGTSNVHLARKYSLTPVGTMAHEWIMAGQQLAPTLRESQIFMLDSWVKEYRGDLGIALTDTLGIDNFWKDFDRYYALLFTGIRHDSGGSTLFGLMAEDKYKSYGIDTKTKSIVFSDGLNFGEAEALNKMWGNKFKVSCGIGTNLTNDKKYGIPLNIVMKLVKVNGQPVAKISDSSGKGMCEDDDYLKLLKKTFEI